MMNLLRVGGRAGVIVPDGVLFGSSNAHRDLRKMLIEECELQGIVKMPAGVFKPYAGVSTAVLIFVKGGRTEYVWYYDMQADGWSLDDKREKVAENDIPDVIARWRARDPAKDTDRDGEGVLRAGGGDSGEQVRPGAYFAEVGQAVRAMSDTGFGGCRTAAGRWG